MGKKPLTPSPFAPTELPSCPPVRGMRIHAANVGIRYKSRPDALVVTFDKPAVTAGVLTVCTTRAAVVDWCADLLAQGQKASALVVGAGNANAYTGVHGITSVQAIADATAAQMNSAPTSIYQAYTGVIGQPFPAEKIITALPSLLANPQQDAWVDAATAIMTTDTFPKISTRQAVVNGEKVTINGIAKGSGMIAPNMATMLGFIFTDAPIDQPTLQLLLREATHKSFNSITVDSDMSTNDTLLAFATGEGELRSGLDAFASALQDVCLDLALQIVKDGEGITKLMRIRVTGADSDADAHEIGLSIGNSPLVKTAIAAADANWGRIIMAIGKTKAKVDKNTITLSIGGVPITRDGQLVPNYDETPVALHMQGSEIDITVDLGLSDGQATIYASDLTHAYIDINAGYRS